VKKMRFTVFAATLAFLLSGTPAFAGSAPDFDADGVADSIDNCSEKSNDAQDDTDADDCGNICDADYDGSGVVGLADFGEFSAAFSSSDEEFCHTQVIPGNCVVGLDDFGYFSAAFSGSAGPSGTTAGTTACPL
jgi:hypothetical protein